MMRMSGPLRRVMRMKMIPCLLLVSFHHARNKKCFMCSQPTLGLFNTAFEICRKSQLKGNDVTKPFALYIMLL
ncbi:unnamed protein product [Coffea canephora]|uniref:Uncharacterized protein n=1 Tax=Coffea canephora TaxID=49390 RepID=A0A068UKH7_COFCA|nr:unnamed protein product [Coffea canephora]